MEDLLSRIPNGPKIPLPNYLLNLVDETDGKESSLYLNGVEGIIQDIWREIIRNNWRTLHVRRFIPEKLGIHSGGVYSCKNGKKGISIQMLYELLVMWKELCDRTDTDLREKWDKVFESNFTLSVAAKGQKVVLPKHITPKLSYLIGWICGDGHFYDRGNHYLVKISEKSVPQLELVLKPLFHELFSIDPPIFQRYMGSYAIQIGSKPLHRFFTRALGVKVGEIPSFISDLDRTNKAFFLAGIFDADGYVNPSYKDSVIVVSQADESFLREISSLFADLGVRFGKPYLHRTKLGEWYTIKIRRKEEILKFAEEVGSFHIDKSRKLKKLVEEINENWNR